MHSSKCWIPRFACVDILCLLYSMFVLDSVYYPWNLRVFLCYLEFCRMEQNKIKTDFENEVTEITWNDMTIVLYTDQRIHISMTGENWDLLRSRQRSLINLYITW